MSNDWHNGEYEEAGDETVGDEDYFAHVEREAAEKLAAAQGERLASAAAKAAYTLPSLGSLIEQYNAMLGWTQARLADVTGKGAAEISKIVSGRTRRPHDGTLARIAEAYQQAGLTGVTFDLLCQARDRTAQLDSGLWDIPDHWLRLVRAVLVHDQEFQDATYRKWSLDLRETASLLARGVGKVEE